MPGARARRLLFVVYCIQIGALLVLLPWSSAWDHLVMRTPWLQLNGVLLHAGVRGAVTGFGLVHLVWGAHDLELWLLELGRPREDRRQP